jgi:hypothetical protein
MKIFSDDKLSYIGLTFRETLSETERQISGRTDVRIAAEVSCHEFSGRSESIWLERDEINLFPNDLRQFERQRQGIVTLASLGAPSEYNEFSLQLYATDSIGHAAVRVDLLKR